MFIKADKMGHFSFYKQLQSRCFDRGQGVESNYLNKQLFWNCNKNVIQMFQKKNNTKILFVVTWRKLEE